MKFKHTLALIALGLHTLLWAAPQPCPKLMSVFLNPEVETFQTIELKISDSDKKELIQLLRDQQYSNDEIVIAIESLNELADVPSVKKIEAYLDYISTYPVDEKRVALRDLNQLYQYESHSPYVRRFYRSQQKLDRKEERQKKIIAKNLASKYPQMTEDEVLEMATKDAKAYRTKYESLYYGCSARTMTSQHAVAQQSYMKFTTGIGLAATATTYSVANWEKEKNGEWYGRLLHELTYSLVSNFIASKFTIDPKDSQAVKSFKNYLINRGISTIDIVTYQNLWGENSRSGKNKLEAILKSPDFQVKIDKIMKDLESQWNRALYKNLMEFKGEIGLDYVPEGLPKDVNWKSLSKEELKRKDVQDILIAAATASIYEDKKGAIIQTGISGVDRFAYNSVFGFVMIPGGMLKQYLIYNTLCMGQDNPKLAIVKALGIYTTYNLISSQLYFEMRNFFINQ